MHRYATEGVVDWDRLFARFGSGVDFPVSCVWRELADHYPEAKVVLTVRDPERWWESTATTIYGFRDVFPSWLQRLVPPTRQFLEMNERLVWDGLFDGRLLDRDHAIAVYERHISDVQAALPPERLLTFEVAQGWAPLCDFLDVPVPSRPFPRLNDAATIRRRVGAIRWVTRALPVVPAVAVAARRVRSRR